MPWYVWIGIVWLICTIGLMAWMEWAMEHAPEDPEEIKRER